MPGRIVYANFRVHWCAHHDVLLLFSGRQRSVISWIGKAGCSPRLECLTRVLSVPSNRTRLRYPALSHLLRGKYRCYDMLVDLSKDNTGCSAMRAFSGRPWWGQGIVCQSQSRHERDNGSQALPDRSLSGFQLAVNSCKPLADGIFDKLSAIMDIELLH